MKYSNEFKLKCIDMYYQGEYPETPEGMKLEIFHKQIREWVRISERSSLESVMHKTNSKQRTAEEKLEYVQQVLAGKACGAVAEENGIECSMLYQWVRKYRMEGYEGLVNKPKGRKPKEPRQMPKKEKPRELTESEREELLRLRAENEYLRAETAAIKKLMALRREEEAARLEAKKQQRSKRSEKKDTD